MNIVVRSAVIALCLGWVDVAGAASNVYLTEVPDYSWHAGCFGTASGNLIGYWDRHGFPKFYTGPTAGGVAPLNDAGPNRGIHALWASQAGVDGRPQNQPGHMDDYYVDYESTDPDPYVTAGRAEHTADCIGDFIGLSQNKWRNLNGECDGNIDAFSFVYWDTSGAPRTNYVPGPEAGLPAVDIPSGLAEFTRWRGYTCDTVTQLTDFNPTIQPGSGFRFEHLMAEIDAGYPVLLYMQYYDVLSREMNGVPHVNPNIHGMLAYGYLITESGQQYVRFRTSWASGDNQLHPWIADWGVARDLPVKGVICYRPKPQLVAATRTPDGLRLEWHGPRSNLYDVTAKTTRALHRYVVERSPVLAPDRFEAITGPIDDVTVTIADCCAGTAFYRIRLAAE